jgi:hypothetical protein
MLPKSLRLAFVLFATLCLAAAVTTIAKDDRKEVAQPAADKGKPEKKSAEPSAADFDAFMKFSQPGKEHALLKQMAGTFDADVETSMAPGAPVIKSKATQKGEMLLGGRYLRGVFSGDMMGMPFQGFGITGYDNQKKKYFSTWIDSMSTGMMVAEGSADASGKVLTFTGTYDDPMLGRKVNYRHVTTIVSPDKFTFEMFMAGEDGKEHRSMFTTYTRVK